MIRPECWAISCCSTWSHFHVEGLSEKRKLLHYRKTLTHNLLWNKASEITACFLTFPMSISQSALLMIALQVTSVYPRAIKPLAVRAPDLRPETLRPSWLSRAKATIRKTTTLEGSIFPTCPILWLRASLYSHAWSLVMNQTCFLRSRMRQYSMQKKLFVSSCLIAAFIMRPSL